MAEASIPGGRKCFFEEEYQANNGGYGTVTKRRRVERPYEEAILIGSQSADGYYHLPVFDLDYPARLHHDDRNGPCAVLEVCEEGPLDWIRRIFGSPKRSHRPRLGERAAICKFLDLAHKYGLIADPYRNDPWLKEEGRLIVPFPAITFVVPATLVPSSTPEHHHLYLDVRLDWNTQYRPLLKAAGHAGVIQKEYYTCSRDADMAFLLKPGLTKDAIRAAQRISKHAGPGPR